MRDHYLTIGWDKTPPAPPVPAGGDRGTRARYVEAYERITGRAFSDWYGTSGGDGRVRSTAMPRYAATVDITHLPGILDPQGATIDRALPALGYAT